MIRFFSLRTRFLAAVVTILVIIGGLLLIYIHTSLRQSLALQVQKRGVSIAHSIARMAANPSLTENYIQLQLLVLDFRKGEEDIEYVFITDRHGQLLAHTFKEGFPVELANANPLPVGQKQHIRQLKTSHGRLYDIVVPIIGGELGAVHVGLDWEVVLQGVRETTWRATWMLLGLLALASGGAVLMAASLTRPIEKLIAGVDAIGNGKLGQRVAADERDEIGHLATAFNRMAENLEATTVSRDEVDALNQQLEAQVEERTEQLVRMNQELAQEVAERRQAEETIRQLNDDLEQKIQERTHQLQATNLELDAFNYSISHDLNAPLRHIDAFSLMLLEDHHDQITPQGVHYLGRIRSGVAKMTKMVAALLSISRLGRQEMHRQQVDLSSMAKDIAQQLRESEPDRQVSVEIAAGLVVTGDSALLEIVLQNLLGNAWKYTATRDLAEIRFGVVGLADGPAYFVQDNGIGFDMAHREKLFGVFRRLVAEDSFPGTGIGLATVQRIIARHGGRVWAEGQPDLGATFYFTV